MGYKAKSITSKASSACKMNMALIRGEKAIGEVKKAGIGDLKDSFDAGIAPKEESPIEMKSSPAKIDPMTIMKVASMAGSIGGGKKGGGGGGGTKVVVNNTANSDASSESNSQASNAIDPK